MILGSSFVRFVMRRGKVEAENNKQKEEA